MKYWLCFAAGKDRSSSEGSVFVNPPWPYDPNVKGAMCSHKNDWKIGSTGEGHENDLETTLSTALLIPVRNYTWCLSHFRKWPF
jgi:hypothetical protein